MFERNLTGARFEPLERRQLLSTARFSWSTPDRFGLDGDHDGLIDVHNDGAFVNPGTFRVNFDASQSTGRRLHYQWTVTGAPLGRKRLSGTYTQPNAFWMQVPPGQYDVKLEVWERRKPHSFSEQVIEVKDILYVSMGDSVASGEGCPEIDRTRSGTGMPVWGDSPADRARHFGGYQTADAQAALKLERDDPHTSVTFVSVASSGASILDGLLGTQHGARGFNLQPQVDSVAQVIGGMQLAVLRLSIGGNDIRFSDIVKRLVAHNSPFSMEKTYQIGADVNQALATLDQNFNYLAQAVRNRLHVSASNVYLTEYPDPVSGTDHDILDDANRGWSGDFVDASLDRGEMDWAEQSVMQPLNWGLWNAAARLGWNYVGGIANRFSGHGYETAQPWIVSYQDAMALQGLDYGEDNPAGMLHPNYEGQRQIAAILYDAIRPRIPQDRRSIIEGRAVDSLKGVTARVKYAPVAAVNGQTLTLRVSLTNDTLTRIKGNAQVEVYLCADPSITAASLLLGVRRIRKMRLSAGGTVTLDLNVTLPPDAPTGRQYLVLRVTPPSATSRRDVMGLSQLIDTEKDNLYSGDV